jgi:predicted O-linked N-acetylglucosamine transferase (SPINDLY family)
MQIDPIGAEALQSGASHQKTKTNAAVAANGRAAGLVKQAWEALAAGKTQQALAYANEALQIQPLNSSALQAAGQCELMLGNPERCRTLLTQVLASDRSNALALNNRGTAQEHLGDLSAALLDYEEACRVEPAFEDALFNRATCLMNLGRLEEAESRYRELIALSPKLADAHFGLGITLDRQHRPEDSVQAYRTAVQADAGHGLAWYNLGNSLMDLKRLDEAIEAFGTASSILPNYGAIYNNCANAFKQLNLQQDALTLYEAACNAEPRNVEARYNKALQLVAMQRWVLAIEACSELFKLAPDHGPGYNCLGIAFSGLRHHVAALDAYKTAARLVPGMAEAYANQAGTLEMLARHEEAIEAYKKALEILPNYHHIPGRLGYKQLYICDWSDYEGNRASVIEGTSADKAVCDPFRMLAFSDSAAMHFKTARLWNRQFFDDEQQAPYPVVLPRHQKIRIGYFSADFHLHATALLMKQFFELHDRSRFEISAFSFGINDRDAMNEKLRPLFDHYFDVRTMDDAAVVALAREMELDIAVDLKGYTLDSRIGIFQQRAAPIQINYLGFPGTMGAPFIDYIIADRVLIPDHLRDFYTEKVIRVPGAYQVNDQNRDVPPSTPSRAALGLPDHAFVFCCFNNNYKITPKLFDVWMRLLQRVDGSVLWLLADSDRVIENLRREAGARGVDAHRLVFAPRAGLADHLARQRAADLFLDTVPCNAHTTASDALGVGLPVLTCTGTAFASRVAASLLTAQGLDELVTDDLASYERKAFELATHAAEMKRIRAAAEHAALKGRLFDTPELTKAIESGFEQAYERWHAGLPIDHIDL